VLSTGLSGAALWAAQRSAEAAGIGAGYLGACLKVHGFSAALALVLLGWVAADHVPKAWRQGRRRSSGPILLGLLALLSLSGWALYYTADEAWRAWMATGHRWMGVALPVLGCLHGIRRKAKKVLV
jgi:hypothetical protein